MGTRTKFKASVSARMSSRHGSSRYPSAYGHTPSYKSYASVNPDGSIHDSITLTSGIGLPSPGSYAGVSAFNRDKPLHMESDFSKSLDFSMPSTLSSGTTSSSSKKVSSYSSSYSSSSRDGGRPVTEYATDSTYKSTATGPSGVPRTSYSHSTTGYSSENPYKNRSSHYSFNI